MTTTRAPVAGTLLAGRYRLVTALPGRGRWRAHDDIRDRDLLAREVALPDAGRDQAWQEVLRDAAVVARKRHPGIVPVVDAVMDEGVAWVLTEVPAGRGLGDLVRRYGPMPPAEVARIGLEVLDALVAAGAPHGNLTPDDVLLGPDGQVTVSGFAATGAGAGTRGFQPPEGGAGAKADLWALGATLFVAVEGRMPSGGAVRAGALGPALDGLLTADPDRRIDVGGARRLLGTAAGAPVPAAGSGADSRTGNGALRMPVVPSPSDRNGPARPSVGPPGPDPGTPSGPGRPPGPDPHGGGGPGRPVTPADPGVGGRRGPARPPVGRPGPGANGSTLPPVGPAEPAVPAGPGEQVELHDPDIAAALAMLQAALAPVSPPAEDEQASSATPGTAGATRAADPTRPAASRPVPAPPGASEVTGAPAAPGGAGPQPGGPPIVARPAGDAAPTRVPDRGSPPGAPADPTTGPGRAADGSPAPAPPAGATAAGRTAADRATAHPATAPVEETERSRPGDRAATPPSGPTQPSPPADGAATDHPTTTPAETTERSRPADRTTGPRTTPRTGARTTDADDRPATPRRRLVAVAVAAAVLAVLAAVLVPYLLRDDGPDPAAGPSPAPASASASATPDTASPGAPEPPPAGYQLYRDPAGWSIAVPAGWRPDRRGTATTFTDQGRTLKVSYRDAPPRDPYDDALRLEPVVEAATPGYDLVRIAAVRYRGWPTAYWEYRGGTDVRTRTLSRTVVPRPDRGYTISWTTPERTFAADRDYFDIASRTFDPGA